MDFERDLYRGAAGYYPEMFRQPFYLSYTARNRFADEAEYERDSRRLQEMYPKDARVVQEKVSDACDRMEYEGSMMFDEYPDRYSVTALCRKIYREITGEKELQGTACEKDRLYQLIEVMLVHEMFRRRCRYRRCRRWYY